MPIDPTHNSPAVHNAALNGLNKAQPVAPAKQADSATVASAKFHASAATDTSRDIDHARVNDIRQAIGDGSLQLHSDRIADAVLASARELLSE